MPKAIRKTTPNLKRQHPVEISLSMRALCSSEGQVSTWRGKKTSADHGASHGGHAKWHQIPNSLALVDYYLALTKWGLIAMKNSEILRGDQ